MQYWLPCLHLVCVVWVCLKQSWQALRWVAPIYYAIKSVRLSAAEFPRCRFSVTGRIPSLADHNVY
jgi:hypothetical protein